MRLAFCVMLLLLVQGCAERIQKSATEDSKGEISPSSVQTKPAIKGFEPVKQMLSTNCSPCHNPGGKMYERLPFDSPDTVRAHSTQISGRLKKTEDKKLMEDWLSEPQL
jgi:hypothetical protein